MIQANELRIGNWVYSHEIGDNVQISAISEDGFSFKDCVTWDYPNIEEIHPIPLTEEILLKCGFKKVDNYFKVGRMYLYWHENFSAWHLNRNSILAYCDTVDAVEYLHELQNVYYWNSKDDYTCSEREELNIKF